jgi:hypothetical protein
MSAGEASFSVRVTPAGDAATTLASRTLTNLGAREDWVRSTLDLTAFAGRTVSVRFTLDKGFGTMFRLDDVTLVCGAAPVAVAVAPPLPAVLPLSATTLTATVSGSTDTAVTWRVREPGGGTVDTGGSYTAPSRSGIYHVVATAHADPLATGEASILVLPAVTLSPATRTLTTNQTITLALATTPDVRQVDLALQEGTRAGTAALSSDGASVAYAAPATPGTYHLVASDHADPARQAVATLSVRAPEPWGFFKDTFTMAAGSTYDLSMYGGVELTFAISEGADGGSLSATYVSPDESRPTYTAPAAPGVYHIVATGVVDTSQQATLTVTVRDGLVIDGPTAAAAGAGVTLNVTLAGVPGAPPNLEWSTNPAVELTTYTAGCSFTAPASSGTLTVTARAGADPVRTATFTLTVKGTDQDGDGKTAKDFGDLAVMADAYGSKAAPGAPLATDLNGDGQVDDGDLAEAVAVFEQPETAPLFTPSGARRLSLP